MMNERLTDKLTFCSFWMTIIIVIYHTAPHLIEMSDKLRGENVRNFFETFGPIALNYFFAISAYKFFVSQKDFRGKLLKRVTTLMVPYIVWNTLYILLYMVQNGFPNLETLILGYTLNPFDGPLWYVFVLYIFLTMSFYLDIQTLSKKIIYIALFISVGAALFHWRVITKNYSFTFDYWIERAIRMLPPFLFGAYCGKNSGVMRKNYAGKTCVVGTVAAISAIVAATYLGDGFTTTLLLYFCTLCLWIAIPNFNLKEDSLLKKGVFLIYALHEGVIIILLEIINKSGIDNLVTGACSFMVIIGGVVIIIWIISLIISNIISHCPRIINVMLTGGRNSVLNKK